MAGGEVDDDHPNKKGADSQPDESGRQDSADNAEKDSLGGKSKEEPRISVEASEALNEAHKSGRFQTAERDVSRLRNTQQMDAVTGELSEAPANAGASEQKEGKDSKDKKKSGKAEGEAGHDGANESGAENSNDKPGRRADGSRRDGNPNKKDQHTSETKPDGTQNANGDGLPQTPIDTTASKASTDANNTAAQSDVNNETVNPDRKNNALEAGGTPALPGSAAPPEKNTAAVNPETNSSTVKPEDNTVALNPEANTASVNPEANTVAPNPEANTAAVNPDSNTVAVKPETNISAAKPDANTTAVPGNNLLSPGGNLFSPVADAPVRFAPALQTRSFADPDTTKSNPEVAQQNPQAPAAENIPEKPVAQTAPEENPVDKPIVQPQTRGFTQTPVLSSNSFAPPPAGTQPELKVATVRVTNTNNQAQPEQSNPVPQKNEQQQASLLSPESLSTAPAADPIVPVKVKTEPVSTQVQGDLPGSAPIVPTQSFQQTPPEQRDKPVTVVPVRVSTNDSPNPQTPSDPIQPIRVQTVRVTQQVQGDIPGNTTTPILQTNSFQPTPQEQLDKPVTVVPVRVNPEPQQPSPDRTPTQQQTDTQTFNQVMFNPTPIEQQNIPLQSPFAQQQTTERNQAPAPDTQQPSSGGGDFNSVMFNPTPIAQQNIPLEPSSGSGNARSGGANPTDQQTATNNVLFNPTPIEQQRTELGGGTAFTPDGPHNPTGSSGSGSGNRVDSSMFSPNPIAETHPNLSGGNLSAEARPSGNTGTSSGGEGAGMGPKEPGSTGLSGADSSRQANTESQGSTGRATEGGASSASTRNETASGGSRTESSSGDTRSISSSNSSTDRVASSTSSPESRAELNARTSIDSRADRNASPVIGNTNDQAKSNRTPENTTSATTHDVALRANSSSTDRLANSGAATNPNGERLAAQHANKDAEQSALLAKSQLEKTAQTERNTAAATEEKRDSAAKEESKKRLDELILRANQAAAANASAARPLINDQVSVAGSGRAMQSILGSDIQLARSSTGATVGIPGALDKGTGEAGRGILSGAVSLNALTGKGSDGISGMSNITRITGDGRKVGDPTAFSALNSGKGVFGEGRTFRGPGTDGFSSFNDSSRKFDPKCLNIKSLGNSDERGGRNLGFDPRNAVLISLSGKVGDRERGLRLAGRMAFSPESKRYLTGIEIALAAAIAASAIAKSRADQDAVNNLAAEQLKDLLDDGEPGKEADSKDADDSTQANKNGQQTANLFKRPTHMVQPNESLISIAEAYFNDSDIAWLLADINSANTIEHFEDGKRIVELRSRQEIQLPLPSEITDFFARRAKDQRGEQIVTIVAESQIDKELLNSFLGTVVGAAQSASAPETSVNVPNTVPALALTAELAKPSFQDAALETLMNFSKSVMPTMHNLLNSGKNLKTFISRVDEVPPTPSSPPTLRKVETEQRTA